VLFQKMSTLLSLSLKVANWKGFGERYPTNAYKQFLLCLLVPLHVSVSRCHLQGVTVSLFISYSRLSGVRGGSVVEALRFDSRWYHWNFSLTLSFRPHYGPGVDSASNRNKYQEYFLGVKAAAA
jgi:hypothetical protein